jgi:hypothetical protein
LHYTLVRNPRPAIAFRRADEAPGIFERDLAASEMAGTAKQGFRKPAS